ncbi:hypothetical protein MMC28_007050 [Mycoblastus sanguinarius]|nr:hypothetical protein [Mycoblastus sanguinarius]
MSLARVSSFPLSHIEESSRTQPFPITHEEAVNLHSCRAFQAIRGFLSNQQVARFCQHHRPTSKEHEEAWLLQRDITYALILPVLEIYRHAAQLARSMLGDRNIFDLELVFRGDARGAFAWLQCFITEEEEWCSTRGCPACVVSYVLQAEPTIRIVLTACRLAQSLRRANENADIFPVFDFWLSSLRTALDEDEFWQPNFWKDSEQKVANLENGIQQMVRQCINLENVRRSGNGLCRSRHETVMAPTVGVSAEPAKLGTYKLDGTRMVFISEESCWMQRIVLGCWTTLLADAANVGRSAHDVNVKAMPPSVRPLSS